MCLLHGPSLPHLGWIRLSLQGPESGTRRYSPHGADSWTCCTPHAHGFGQPPSGRVRRFIAEAVARMRGAGRDRRDALRPKPRCTLPPPACEVLDPAFSRHRAAADTIWRRAGLTASVYCAVKEPRW